MVPDVAAALRAPANGEPFLDGRVVVALVRGVALGFFGAFVLRLAAFGVESQDDVTRVPAHFGSTHAVIEAEHAHPADSHFLALRKPDVAFRGFVNGHCAEHVLVVPRKAIAEHGAVAESYREYAA